MNRTLRLLLNRRSWKKLLELLEMAESLLKQWFEQRTNRSILLQLQRAVHSLKGGARMVGLEAVQAIAYQLENAFEQFALHQFQFEYL